MNIEQTKECIRVMQAFVDGKELISMRTPAVTADDPYWNWGNDTKMYRIKPTATLRPWTTDEVPLDCWIRMIVGDNRYKWKPVTVQPLGVITIPADIGYSLKLNTWQFLATEYEHSIDNGKTWLPCGVMEEAK
jgi:hypothetical protein